MDAALGMIVYSALLTLGLTLAAPWWGWRMLISGRYRTGLAQRLGHVPAAVRAAMAERRVVWVHAVSVGEVLAVARLVRDLQAGLGADWTIAVSTTTSTGQAIARERLTPMGCVVFFYPLDFAFAVRAWLRALRPELVVLVESELWPRMLQECKAANVPVAVVNARMSDRSFRRTLRARRLWLAMAAKVTRFLAQSEETAVRLRALGVADGHVVMAGNLKFDLVEIGSNAIAVGIKKMAAGRKVLVAGSTLGGLKTQDATEETMLIQAWKGALREQGVVLVLAPRHPERFDAVWAAAAAFRAVRASGLDGGEESNQPFANDAMDGASGLVGGEIVLLDTLGDLAAVYGVADVAFVGGSLVRRGGHNPLEAARFGVPVVMGPSYENFREIVDGMQAAGAICIVEQAGLEGALTTLLDDDGGMGERGRAFFAAKAGATERTVAALLELLR